MIIRPSTPREIERLCSGDTAYVQSVAAVRLTPIYGKIETDRAVVFLYNGVPFTAEPAPLEFPTLSGEMASELRDGYDDEYPCECGCMGSY